MVHGDGSPHDRCRRENPVHDGRAADSDFSERPMGQLRPIAIADCSGGL